MSRFSYEEEMRKVPLNPDMIRHEIQKSAGDELTFGLCTGVSVTAVFGAFLAFFCPLYSWDAGTFPLIFGIFMVLVFTGGIAGGILVMARLIRHYRRASRGEITVEMDTVTYIEHDRPRVVNRRYGSRTVYEDFLHFKSGREFRDADQKYRHMNTDGETFIVAAYSESRDTVLRIYRLADYNWQE